MKPIFTKSDYQILADVESRKACIVKGSNSVYVALEELTPLSALAAKHLRMMGCDPKRYLNIGHSNHVIIKEAAAAWQAALEKAELTTEQSNSSMIHRLWQNLPGLMELRDAEDTYAACQKSASLMLEYQQRGLPPTRLMELRQKYPRAAAYILAEAYAFSGSDNIAELGRHAMHLLISGAPIEEALALLPNVPPDGATSEQYQQSALRW